MDDDAVAFQTVLDRDEAVPPLLPDWYMPAPMVGARRLRGWRRMVAWVIVLSFVAITASGLCSTYGIVTT